MLYNEKNHAKDQSYCGVSKEFYDSIAFASKKKISKAKKKDMFLEPCCKDLGFDADGKALVRDCDNFWSPNGPAVSAVLMFSWHN